jgi:hypothetical protein
VAARPTLPASGLLVSAESPVPGTCCASHQVRTVQWNGEVQPETSKCLAGKTYVTSMKIVVTAVGAESFVTATDGAGASSIIQCIDEDRPWLVLLEGWGAVAQPSVPKN